MSSPSMSDNDPVRPPAPHLHDTTETERRTLAQNTGRPLSEAGGQRIKHPIPQNPRNRSRIF